MNDTRAMIFTVILVGGILYGSWKLVEAEVVRVEMAQARNDELFERFVIAVEGMTSTPKKKVDNAKNDS
jgi:hypothetical protein